MHGRGAEVKNSSIEVVKVLNNNVIIAAHPVYREVVVIGKGIGFNRKAKDHIPSEAVEKLFILTNEKEKEQYQQLIPQIDEKLIEVMNEVILYISEHAGAPLNEHIHIALTDHIAFAIKRLEQGIVLQNPFLLETRELYPQEYAIADYVIRTINDKMNVHLPPAEVGFVTLHIHGAITNRPVSEVNEYSRLIGELIGLIERQMHITIDRSTIAYSRLLRHLRFAIERVKRKEAVHEPDKLGELLKQQYPEIYSIAWTLMKVMQRRLRQPVYEAEAVYLTMHLIRLMQKDESLEKEKPAGDS
ncbi:transcription antiterminator [Paenibacillus chitinolyticus]|uniref:glucose PTS transporter transcription antiterminator GlcT n=1 Tax=Paenibacillus chitinolyticus TaxID=79263 RepID=UPI002DB7A3BF|nr:transcription antiterminator [Paenibacillus chitinolyticus]MEC0249473.1 transcription antiterminator [Paenibacillus chitinolyticus]